MLLLLWLVGCPAVPVTLRHTEIPLQQLIQSHDNLAAVMTDIMALQASSTVTGREDLVFQLQSRLQSLSDSLVQDEEQDKIATAQLMADLSAQLEHAQLVLNTTPEQLHELETMLQRSFATGNETSQNIEHVRQLRGQFETEMNAIRTAVEELRAQHHQRLADIEHDKNLLKEIENILGTKVGCSHPDASNIQLFLQQLRSTHLAAAASSFLEISNGIAPGCCVQYDFDFLSRPCCFNFTDGVDQASCVGTHHHHHPGALCSAVKFLYEQEVRTGDVCSQQHHSSGQASCNDITYCGSPSTCATCKYNAIADVCYTETCDIKRQLFESACFGFDSCFLSTPTASCCERLLDFQSSKCAADHAVVVCGTEMSIYSGKCPGSAQNTRMCQQLLSIVDTIGVKLSDAAHHEDLVFAQQVGQIQKDKTIVESNLQKTVNEVEMLQLSLATTTQRSVDFENELKALTETSIADAENIIATIPERIETVKIERQARKEKRDKELQLISRLSTIISELTEQPPVNVTSVVTSGGVMCHHFNRPGYYYHPDGQQPITIECPTDTACGIEKIILDPLTNPTVYIVRLGCLSELTEDPSLNVHECGASSCPSAGAMYTVECCPTDLCNAVTGELATKVYQAGQCDPETCSCHPFVREVVRPSPFPSSSAMPSPSLSRTSSPSPSVTASPSASRSFSATPSPSTSPYAHSCETIKSENPTAASGIYSVSLGHWNQKFDVFCDMDADSGAGYTLLWKNVGGTVHNVSLLRSDKDLMASNHNDVVIPAFSKMKQPRADISQFHSTAFEFYAHQPNTEWVKHMALYDGEDMIRIQRIKVVMTDVTMGEVFANHPTKGMAATQCIHSKGTFDLYSTADISDVNRIDHFMGRTSTFECGIDSSGLSSYGLPTTVENHCPELHESNLIRDVSTLRRLTNDLQLATNEAWETVQNLFGYDHDSVNPRDFSRCMFRCWNGRDGNFHETFVWSARQGCPGFLFTTGQRCSGHGVCVGGKCQCDDGWTGPGCAAKKLEPLCGPQPHIPHGHEDCSGNRCEVVCDKGYVLKGPSTWECSDQRQWVGPALSQCVPECLHNCSAHGVCVSPGNCSCEIGWVGEGCQAKSCRSEPLRIAFGVIECSNGQTIDHSCAVTCDDGYRVKGPQTVTCDNGMWADLGECVPVCTDDCNHHGNCVHPGTCVCDPGFKGDACHLPDCPALNQCNHHGICVSNNVCLCDREWDGPACDLQIRVLSDIALFLVGNSSQLIELPPMGTFQKLTIEWWLLPLSVEGSQMILEGLQTTDGALSVSLVDGKYTISLEGHDSISFDYKLVDRVWTHVSFVFDTSSHTVACYIDGTKFGEKVLPSNQIVIASTRLGGTLKHPFQGYMKELRVWNIKRKSLEIATAAYEALTGTNSGMEALYHLSGPLRANTIYLDDLTGRHSVSMTGGVWARAPTAPPGPRRLPPVYHNAEPAAL
eukprot:c9779_g1_i1.p1 GENE.c9779_g1_i1~~c9779_g1_i1.p1  ORF type:complete len:1455 (-),score=449.10 c9779_g1_i1:19-4383(-)